MSQQSITDLKSAFIRGKRPTEEDFSDLVDTTVQKLDYDHTNTELQITGQDDTVQDTVDLQELSQEPVFDTASKELTLSDNDGIADLSGFLWAPNAGNITIDQNQSKTLDDSSNLVPTSKAVLDYVDGLHADALNIDLVTMREKTTSSSVAFVTTSTEKVFSLSGNHTDEYNLLSTNGSGERYFEVPEKGDYEFAVRLRWNYSASSAAKGAFKWILNITNSSDVSQKRITLFESKGTNFFGTRAVQMFQRVSERITTPGHRVYLEYISQSGITASWPTDGLQYIQIKKLINEGDFVDSDTAELIANYVPISRVGVLSRNNLVRAVSPLTQSSSSSESI